MNKQGLLYHDSETFWIGVSANGEHTCGRTVISSGNDRNGVLISKPSNNGRIESYLVDESRLNEFLGHIDGDLNVTGQAIISKNDGGTLLTLQDKRIDPTKKPTENLYSNISFADSNNVPIGMIETAYGNTGDTSCAIVAKCLANDGKNTVTNMLQTQAKTDGTLSYYVSDKAAFRNAIGITDSGWKTLALTNDFVPYSNNADYTPKYRRIGNLVMLSGQLSPKTTSVAINASGGVTVGTLPAGYRPVANAYAICQGSSMAIFFCRVNTDGTVSISRYRDSFEKYSASISTNYWLPFSMTFMTV